MIIIDWQILKEWFCVVVIGIGILFLTYAAITSLLIGQVWDLLFLVMFLLYLGTYIVVFIPGKRRFGSKLMYQVAFILVTWVFILIMMGVESLKTGTFDPKAAVKYSITPVVAMIFFAPDEDDFSGGKTTASSAGDLPRESRPYTPQSGSIFERLGPVTQDTNSYEYQPYTKKDQNLRQDRK